VLGWRPDHEDLEVICSTAYKWEAHLRRVQVRGTQGASPREVGPR